jgi:channel protein (hemolysin III family)
METINLLGFTDPLSSWSHLISALTALLATFPLVKKGQGSPARVFALLLYSFSLIFLFAMSGTFHLLENNGIARAVLQRLDHAGIWVLIAGTFTPIHVILFRGPWRWLILLVVWLIAINGLVLEVVYFKTFPEWLALSFFLGLGWMGALTGYKFRRSFKGESLFWLAAGGIFYSIGAIMDFTRTPVLIQGYLGPHEIFHLFVILGAASHWRFVWDWADHPVANKIFFEIRMFSDGKFLGEATTDHLKVEGHDLQDLKEKIQSAVKKKYHSSIQPEIHLRYFQEEILRP